VLGEGDVLVGAVERERLAEPGGGSHVGGDGDVHRGRVGIALTVIELVGERVGAVGVGGGGVGESVVRGDRGGALAAV